MSTPGDEMTDDERMRDANYKERRRREEDKKKVADDAVGEQELLKKRRNKIAAATKKADKAARSGGGLAGEIKGTKRKKLKNSDDPPLENIVQDYNSSEEDEEFEEEDWVIQGHAVDAADGKAKFKVVYGKREDGSDKYLWGTYSSFVKDGLAGLDEYILEKCPHHAVYKNLIKKKPKIIKAAEPKNKSSVRSPCSHGDLYNYREEGNAGYCRKSYYLHGLMCANKCGAAFAERKAEGHPEGLRVVVPTGNAPVRCCVNVRGSSGRERREEEGTCMHVLCPTCWAKTLLAQGEGGKRRSRRSTSD